jgi:L-alanine-DL-glutamate epimerase-like enolase superfamily enzyme
MKSDPVTGGARYEGGAIMLSEEPGHGADYEREFLTQCPCVSVE